VRGRLLERRTRYFEEEAKIFARVLDEGKCQGIFGAPNSMETARTLLIATNSLLPYSLNAKELGERKDLEKKTRRLADLLLQGLITR
jgi:hypothetical protein